jgi:CubicO group peptidase (beta-lactamase class C family)
MLERIMNWRWAIQLEAQGNVDAGFEPVVDSFLDGFESGRDLGASVAVYLEGERVVDLWAGYRDRRKEKLWERDTLCCLFSVSKAITAICILQAIEEGLLDLDTAVCKYWREFGVNGKESITLRHILSHQSGVVGFHEPVARELLYDWDAVVAALAREHPWWPPGEKHGYHARTFGFLLGEVLKRVSGKSVGRWVRERLVDGEQGEFSIGLNVHEIERCADMVPARIRPDSSTELPPERQEMMAAFRDLSTPTGAAFQNPSMGPAYMNSTPFRTAQLPAMNGHGTASGVADIFSRIEQLIGPELLADASRTHSYGRDEVLCSVSRIGLGFMLYDEAAPIGVRTGSFGHAGAGGSMAFYDPQRKLSFCFAMNQMQEGVVSGSTSAMQIAESVYTCLR